MLSKYGRILFSGNLSTVTRRNGPTCFGFRPPAHYVWVGLAASVILIGAGSLNSAFAVGGDPRQTAVIADRVSIAPTDAALARLDAAGEHMVVREGVQLPGDAPALTFRLFTGRCAHPDGYVEVALANGGCARAVIPASGLDPRQEGAKFDGTTDDTAALQRAFTYAAKHSAKLNLPAGRARFSAMLSIPSGYKRFTIAGAGDSTVLQYAGTSRTGDLIEIGTPGSSGANSGITLTGFRVTSATQMTGGAALHLWHVVLSRIDPIIDSQDGSGRFYDGIWFDECDVVDVPNVEMAGASRDVVLLNGSRRAESWWPNYVDEIRFGRGKISPTNSQTATNALPLNGVHIAGGVGGLSFDSVDIIANKHNITIDQAVAGTGNQTITFGPTTYLDISQHDDIVIDDNSPPTQWQGGTKLIDFGGWIASGGQWGSKDPSANCINLKAFAAGRVLLRGNVVGACMNNGIYDQDPAATLEVASSEDFYSNGHYDIASAVSRPGIAITNARFSGRGAAFDANTLTSTLPIYTGEIAMATPVGLAIGGATRGISYSARRSYYQLLGHLVVVDFGLNLSKKGPNRGALTLIDLPGSETPGAALGGGGSVRYYTGWSGLAGGLDLSVDSLGRSMANIYQSTAGGIAPTFDTNLTDRATLWGEVQYFR